MTNLIGHVLNRMVTVHHNELQSTQNFRRDMQDMLHHCLNMTGGRPPIAIMPGAKHNQVGVGMLVIMVGPN